MRRLLQWTFPTAVSFEKSVVRFRKTPFHFRPQKPEAWLAGSWSSFSFPDEGNFNANSILGPGYLIYFLQPGTDVNSPVAADSSGQLRHGAPIKLDRFGNLPTIYTNTLNSYDISVRNEYGVERHLIEGY